MEFPILLRLDLEVESADDVRQAMSEALSAAAEDLADDNSPFEEGAWSDGTHRLRYDALLDPLEYR